MCVCARACACACAFLCLCWHVVCGQVWVRAACVRRACVRAARARACVQGAAQERRRGRRFQPSTRREDAALCEEAGSISPVRGPVVRQTRWRIPCTRSGGRQRGDACPVRSRGCAGVQPANFHHCKFSSNFHPSVWTRAGELCGGHEHHQTAGQCDGGACGAGGAFGGSTVIGCVNACRLCPIVDRKRYSAMTVLSRACTHAQQALQTELRVPLPGARPAGRIRPVPRPS